MLKCTLEVEQNDMYYHFYPYSTLKKDRDTTKIDSADSFAVGSITTATRDGKVVTFKRDGEKDYSFTFASESNARTFNAQLASFLPDVYEKVYE